MPALLASRIGDHAASQSFGPNPLRSDNFNRTNTTNGLGTPSDGGSAWQGTQNFHIASNKMVTVTGDGGHWVVLDTGGGQISKILFTVAFTTSNQVFLGWGNAANGNAYAWLFNGTSNYYGILRSGGLSSDGAPGGSGAIVGSSTNADFRDGAAHAIELDIAGTTYTAKVDGTTVASGTDSAVTTVFNRIGLYASATTDITIDDLYIYGSPAFAQSGTSNGSSPTAGGSTTAYKNIGIGFTTNTSTTIDGIGIWVPTGKTLAAGAKIGIASDFSPGSAPTYLGSATTLATVTGPAWAEVVFTAVAVTSGTTYRACLEAASAAVDWFLSGAAAPTGIVSGLSAGGSNTSIRGSDWTSVTQSTIYIPIETSS